MTTISHQNLRKNELADVVYKVADWIRNNRQTFYSLAGIAAGVILFAAFVLTRYYLVETRVSDKLSLAQALISHNQVDQGVGLLREVIGQYPNSPSASMARLYEAQYLISQHRFKDAKGLVEYVMASGKPQNITPLAYPYMAEIQENTLDYPAAITTYNEFLTKFPDHFLVPKILESLGRVYELSGQIEQARSMYQRLSTEFKGTKWEQRALERLQALSSIHTSTKK